MAQQSMAEQVKAAAEVLAKQTGSEPSLRALAEAADVDYNNLTRVARGELVPSLATLKAIVDAVPGVRFIVEAGVEIGKGRPVYPSDRKRNEAVAAAAKGKKRKST